MTIQLFPCGHVPCACPQCEKVYDIFHAPFDRVVVYKPINDGVTGLSGTITHSAGSATMIEVVAGDKLCFGGVSYLGPLLYTAGVPYGATLVSASITYTPSSGPPAISFTNDILSTCTNPITDIQREIVSAECYAPLAVVDEAADCPACCADAASRWWVYPSSYSTTFAGGNLVAGGNVITGSCPTVSTCGSLSGTPPNPTIRSPASWNFTNRDMQATVNSDAAFYAMAISTGAVSDTLSFTNSEGLQASFRYTTTVTKPANSWLCSGSHTITPLNGSGTTCHGSVRTEYSAIQDTILVRIPNGGCGALIMSAQINTVTQNGSWPYINYDANATVKMGYAA